MNQLASELRIIELFAGDVPDAGATRLLSAFDVEWYSEALGLSFDSAEKAISHYVSIGAARGLSPHPFFDPDFYLATNRDLGYTTLPAFVHYAFFGEAEGRNPSFHFNPSSIRAHCSNLPEDELLIAWFRRKMAAPCSPCAWFDIDHYRRTIGSTQLGELEHYLTSGAKNRLSPSPWFDADFYLLQCNDAHFIEDLFRHYLTTGWKLGRDPSPAFSTEFYRSANPDVAATDTCPLIHFLAHGTAEKRAFAPSDFRARSREAATPIASANEPFSHADAPATLLAFEVPSASPWTGEDPGPSAERFPATSASHEIATILEAGIFDVQAYRERSGLNDLDERGAIEHYLKVGANAGMEPSAYFDGARYRSLYRDVRESGINPLWHYIVAGEGEGRSASSVFDATYYASLTGRSNPRLGTWLADYLSFGLVERNGPNRWFDLRFYVETYPDVIDAGVDPVLHYIRWGWREGRNPHPEFITRWYQERYLQGDADACPLLHFLEIGESQGHHTRAPTGLRSEDPFNLVRYFSTPGPDHVKSPPSAGGVKPRARAYAFYLPQFHAFPENDSWWGTGFTEWRNTSRAMPRFRGHYQPRVPGDLGFYDLTNPEILRTQAALARSAGLEGFCFYHYWFDGKRLMERPLEALLADPTIELPFCLMWANENWTRRWDGLEAEVLIRQSYSEDDDDALIADFQRHFADPRYLRVDGRPILFIYRAGIIPDSANRLERWRSRWQELHGEQPLFVMAQSFRDLDPTPLGFDAAVEFPPHKVTNNLPSITHSLQRFDPDFTAHVYDYDAVVRASRAAASAPYPLIRTAFPFWDNDARRQGAGVTVHGSTPDKYRAWLGELVDHASRAPVFGESFVFINAWNEWAEGTYLEPDVHYGFAYLDATCRALTELRPSSTHGTRKRLLVGHDAYQYGAQLLLLNLGRVMRRQHGCEVTFLLGQGGPLLDSYKEVGEVIVADDTSIDWRGRIRELAEAGYGSAITNTVVSGFAIEHLHALDFHIVSLIHELPTIIREYRLEERLNAILRYSDEIVLPATFVRDRLASAFELPEDRVTIRPQGVYHHPDISSDRADQLRQELNIPARDAVILNVASGDLRKGLDLFLATARCLLNRRDDVSFVWCGPLHPQIGLWLTSSLEPALAARVHLLPFREDIGSVYALGDVFFLSSREDPFPTVVLEALEIGIPVVGFEDATGTQNLIERFGRLVPQWDVEAAAGAIDEHLRRRGTPAQQLTLEAAHQYVAHQHSFPDYVWDLLARGKPAPWRVTAAIISFNYAHYAAPRLNSILDQTYPVYEVLVADDASTDGSPAAYERVARTASRNIRMEVNQTNTGSVFAQWLRAAEMATGDYIWLAEADDVSSPDFLRTMVEFMRRNELDVAFSDSFQLDHEGMRTGESYRDYYRDQVGDLLERDRIFSADQFLRDVIGVKNLVLNASSVVWRRELLLQTLRSCAEDLRSYRMAGDWRVYVEMTRHCSRIGYVGRPLNGHRRHSDSVTTRLNASEHIGEISRLHRTILEREGGSPELEVEMNSYRDALLHFLAETHRE